jgi:hypothetical protein
VGEDDIRDVIEAMDFIDFGDAEDQKALREVLLKYRDVFRPTTSIVRGPDFSIKLRDGADIPRLNRVAFRKSPLQKKVEEAEMKKLLERGIIEPLLCAAKDETSVDTMGRMFCCNFLRKSRL